jgi:hypothetical protein
MPVMLDRVNLKLLIVALCRHSNAYKLHMYSCLFIFKKN